MPTVDSRTSERLRDHGEFRTKRLVLAAYNAMSQAARTATPHTSPLDPPPGHGHRHLA